MSRPAAILAAVAVLAGAAVSGAAPSRSQRFFANLILEDRRTSPVIRDLLRTGGGFVDRRIAFRDLTGDDRDDAVVRVQTGGASGAVAVYIFSTAGGKRLRPVFRRERLERAVTRIDDGTVVIRSARYAEGDDLCCPSETDVRHVTWDRKQKRFVVTMPSR